VHTLDFKSVISQSAVHISIQKHKCLNVIVASLGMKRQISGRNLVSPAQLGVHQTKNYHLCKNLQIEAHLLSAELHAQKGMYQLVGPKFRLINTEEPSTEVGVIDRW
jgi:hypothetical protein